MPAIDRNRVRTAFDSHAPEYERYACVQRHVVNRFMERLGRERLAPRSILDIGCGTGMLLGRLAESFPMARLAGIDLAPGMVTAARQALAAVAQAEVATGDAERLPFPAGRFDLVVSTSTFQWLENLDTAFGEAFRVLVPGGQFRFALFGERTLVELKHSYRTALHIHGREREDRTHRFLSMHPVAAALERAGFTDLDVIAEDVTEFHPDVPALLRSLRQIGAGNASTALPRGLAERRIMLTMMEVYRREFGGGGSIPATYEVIYAKGEKVGSRRD